MVCCLPSSASGLRARLAPTALHQHFLEGMRERRKEHSCPACSPLRWHLCPPQGRARCLGGSRQTRTLTELLFGSPHEIQQVLW